VCRIFDIQYDSRLAYSSIYSHGCRCSNRILCNSLHIETRISGLGALAFLFVRDCSLIFRYIQRFSCNLRTKVIASIKIIPCHTPSLSRENDENDGEPEEFDDFDIFWWNLRPTSSCGQYDATQGSTASTSPSKSNQSTWESQKTCESQKDSNLDDQFGHEIFVKYQRKNGIWSLMKFGLHRDVWCLWIGLNVSVWDELTEYSMIIIWWSYDIQ